MKRSILFTAVASVCALSFTGCPPTHNIVLGNWLFTFSTTSTSNGLTLNADGTATAFQSDPNGGTLAGDWTWQSDGRNVTFIQDDLGDIFVFSGELLTDMIATGSWTEQGSAAIIGTWNAVFLGP